MVRLGAVALILSSLSAAASAGPREAAENTANATTFQLPKPSARFVASDERVGKTEIAPNTQFGFGMFGLKSEKSPLQPATGREIDMPKQRRAAVGFSLKF